MTAGEALLLAVSAAPEDDAPRLVYADYLDDHGDPARAAFIRAEVAACRAVAAGERLSAAAIARRQELRHERPRWLTELPPLPGVAWGDLFVRGFPAKATVSSAGVFHRVAPRLFRAVPVWAVRVCRVDPRSVPRLAASGYLRRVRHLDLTGTRLTDDALDRLADAGALDAVEELNLDGCELTDRSADRLIGLADAGRLRRAWLIDTPISRGAERRLAAHPRCRFAAAVREG